MTQKVRELDEQELELVAGGDVSANGTGDGGDGTGGGGDTNNNDDPYRPLGPRGPYAT